MAKDNNLKDFLTDVADSIRRKKGTTDKINPQDFSNEIENIETGIQGVSVEDVIGIGKTLILGENIEPNYIKVGSIDKSINIQGVGNNLAINGENTQVLVLNGSITGENFNPENIKKDVNIFGLIGTYEDNAIEGVTEENGIIYIRENSSNAKIYLGSENNIKDIDIVKNQVNVRLYSNNSKTVCYGSNTQIEMMGTQKAVATNLSPQNIKKGVNVLGHIGTFEGGTDTSDATATANDILLGKTAYGKEGRMVGAIETYDGASDVGEVTPNTLKKLLDNTKSCYYLFNNYKGDNLSDLIQYNDTENVKKFSYTFQQCKATTFPKIDTSNGEEMDYFYMGCGEAIELPQVNTIKATTLSTIYRACVKVKKVDLTHYNSSNTNYSYYSFAYCYQLKAVIIRSFGVGYVLNNNAFTGAYRMLGTTDSTENPNGEQGYVYVPRDMITTLQNETNWSTLQFRALEDYTKDGTTTGEFDDEKAGITYE